MIGWYQGRFEWGPRALGNRSILADPRRADMKDIVNTKIKFREPYRPFAPSVLVERAAEYYDLKDPERHYPARFMLLVVNVKEGMGKVVPAPTHVDGTGRLQTVFKDTNPRYHRLIETFGKATGVPVVLNTSFNLKGEPRGWREPRRSWAGPVRRGQGLGAPKTGRSRSEDHMSERRSELGVDVATIRDLLAFFWQAKTWWLTPIIVVLLLLSFVLVFLQSSPVALFIYTLF